MSFAAWVMFALFFVWSFLGMPIGHAMLAAAIVYLFMTRPGHRRSSPRRA